MLPEAAPGVELHEMTSRVRAVVPDLIGLSLGLVQDGTALTLVASAEDITGLDAAQYLGGGPCVAAVDRAEPLETTVDTLLEEDRWRLYAQASAAVGVASSLSLPVVDGDRVVGGVHLYAASSDAFVGHHETLAAAVALDAASAVANADLSIWTRKQSMDAPEKVRERGDLNIALGIISAALGVNMPVARERLRNAAARAGITEGQAARVLSSVRSRQQNSHHGGVTRRTVASDE